MAPEKLEKYNELMSDPLLFRMKMSGPATAITMVEDVIVGFTDRDHLRSFSVGVNDKIALLGSEQRAVISAAYFMHEELNMYDPEAGKIVGFSVKDKKVTKLDYGWKKDDSK